MTKGPIKFDDIERTVGTPYGDLVGYIVEMNTGWEAITEGHATPFRTREAAIEFMISKGFSH